MVMKIFIYRYTSGNSSVVDRKYEARNITSFDQSIDVPTQTMALPETDTDQAILTKAEGNTEKVNFSWIIKDEDTSPVLDASGSAINSFTVTDIIGNNTTWDPRTPDGAYVWFTNFFEKLGVSDNYKYRFEIYDVATSQGLLNKYGIISRITMAKSATDPAIYNATIEFTVGNDITVT
tara:strand:- start:6307 stop:6840 length:534 start_codon:yes stop_codon:yes gene_type:complete